MKAGSSDPGTTNQSARNGQRASAGLLLRELRQGIGYLEPWRFRADEDVMAGSNPGIGVEGTHGDHDELAGRVDPRHRRAADVAEHLRKDLRVRHPVAAKPILTTGEPEGVNRNDQIGSVRG